MKSLANYVGIRPLPDNDRIGMIQISDPFEPGRRINNWGVVGIVPNRLVFHDIYEDSKKIQSLSYQELEALQLKVMETLEVYTGPCEIEQGDLVMFPYQFNLGPEMINGLIPIPYHELYACKRGDSLIPLNGNIFVRRIEKAIFDTRYRQGEVAYVGRTPKYALHDFYGGEVKVGQRIAFQGGMGIPEYESHHQLEDHFGVVPYRNVITYDQLQPNVSHIDH